MKAMVYERYGPLVVIQFAELDRPSPETNECLEKVYAAVVISVH